MLSCYRNKTKKKPWQSSVASHGYISIHSQAPKSLWLVWATRCTICWFWQHGSGEKSQNFPLKPSTRGVLNLILRVNARPRFCCRTAYENSKLQSLCPCDDLTPCPTVSWKEETAAPLRLILPSAPCGKEKSHNMRAIDKCPYDYALMGIRPLWLCSLQW